MRVATIKIAGRDRAVVWRETGWVPINDINAAAHTHFPETLQGLIAADCRKELKSYLDSYRAHPDISGAVIQEPVTFGPPLGRPGKIWGIGLNYGDHAADLDESTPEQPASFMKPATAVIGHGEAIRLPQLAGEVTAEAELGVIIGKRCHKISSNQAREVIFGFTPIIDMTALDILRQNPRYLTRAKSFDTFFSFGPVVITEDEIDDIMGLTVQTVVNGEIRASNTVSNMTFDPLELVRYHSHVMTLEPGDVISTGTPGAWVIHPGDVVCSVISGFKSLENPVVADRE